MFLYYIVYFYIVNSLIIYVYFGFLAPFTARHRYKLFVGCEHISLFEIPLIYPRFGVSNESTIIAHIAPDNPPIINASNKYFGIEHKFVVLQNISATINNGNNTKIAIFWVWTLFTPIKYDKYANVYPNTV